MKYLLFSIIILFSFSVPAQSKGKATIKLSEGRQKFLKKDYWGALDLFRQADKLNPENALINYRLAEAQYGLKHYSIALEYFEKSRLLNSSIDSELELNLGYVHHRLAHLEEAKKHYRAYRESVSEGKGNRVDIKGLIDQCNYAQQLMSAPLPVTIKNLGKDLNSRFDDYAPSITADGRFLVFTSRRPGMSTRVDENGDYKYFEDIYFSEWDDSISAWQPAERFSENVNSDTHDAVLSLSPDGKEIYVYKNDINRAGDIFKSTFDSEWSIPEKLPRPINTSYFESSVSITADGNTMYFISERPTGYGRGDIYVSNKNGNGSWSKPQNLSSVINTEEDEKFVFVHPNGNTLFFSSKGHLTMGSYDIFRSDYKNGEWSVPVNLGYPINTVNEESTFSMTSDNKRLLLSAEYESGMGERDIFEIDISSADILNSLNIDSELLTTRSNVAVYGRIESEGGKPVPFEVVRAVDAKSNTSIFTAESDRRGNYELSLPRDRVYQFSVESKKYGYISEKVSLKGLDRAENELKKNLSLKFIKERSQ